MNTEEKYFWKKFIKWTLDDIDVCIKHDANAGAAKLMCAAIDSFGSFYVGKGFEGDENKVRPQGGSSNTSSEQSGVRKAFIAFGSNYLYELKTFIIRIDGLGKKNGVEILYDHFRNGLIHAGMPEVGLEIIRENDQEILLQKNGYIALINIIALRSSLSSGLEKFTADLNDKNQPERLIRWRDRYVHLKRFSIKNFR